MYLLKPFISVFFLLLSFSCTTDKASQSTDRKSEVVSVPTPLPTLRDSVLLLFSDNPDYLAKGFDFPVGKPNGKGYYNAQGFQENAHLGDDWNAVTGGNSDLGDPIYSIADGYVFFAENIGGGWGNVIRVWHLSEDHELVEALYAHADEITVQAGTFVRKGAQIGTIGTAGGQYLAHLHFEIRADIKLPVGGGYSNDTTGYLNPTVFIESHR